MNFNLNYTDHGGRCETRHSSDPYDYDWSEDHYYEYHNVSIVKDGYSDLSLFPGESEVEAGDEVYVVYVSYNTGDSFGREDGCRTHLWAFSDRKRAYRLAEELAKDADAKPDYDFDHKPLEFEGVPISTNEWKGYFETFICADVEHLIVKRGS